MMEEYKDIFTEPEINELNHQFERVSLDFGDVENPVTYKFQTTGREFEYIIETGVCRVVKLCKGFNLPLYDGSLTTDELLEIKSRFKTYTFDVGSCSKGFTKITLGTGKELWYVVKGDVCVITNIINSTKKRESAGMKFDDDKLLCMAMPAQEYKQILEVLTNGAKKYKIDNWKVVDDARNRYMNGLERHLLDYKEAMQTGNEALKYDNGEGGMGTHHLANLICNAIFLMYFDNNNLN